MTNTQLSALAVESIEQAAIASGIERKAIFRPLTSEERKARGSAMDHMKQQGANICEISRAFSVSEKTVRTAITKERKA